MAAREPTDSQSLEKRASRLSTWVRKKALIQSAHAKKPVFDAVIMGAALTAAETVGTTMANHAAVNRSESPAASIRSFLLLKPCPLW